MAQIIQGQQTRHSSEEKRNAGFRCFEEPLNRESDNSNLYSKDRFSVHTWMHCFSMTGSQCGINKPKSTSPLYRMTATSSCPLLPMGNTGPSETMLEHCIKTA
jgi:hypothetical protein